MATGVGTGSLADTRRSADVTALTDHGFVRFKCTGVELTEVFVGKASVWLP
jgi:hypothetical protein